MAKGTATRTESDRFERWLELIPHCNRAEEGIELGELTGLYDDSAEAILADVQALVDREYYLPGSFADSLTILIDGERLDLTSPDHFQRPIGFSPIEALALQLGLQMVVEVAKEREEASDVAGLLAPVLESAAGYGDDGGDRADFGDHLVCGGVLSVASVEVFERLSTALRERRMVEVLYYKPYELDEPKLRRVLPWVLAQARGNWYFLGFEIGIEELRLFRLDRILEIAVKEAASEAPEDFKVEDYVDPVSVYRESENDLIVETHYGSRIAPWILEMYDAVETREDGCVVVTHRCKSPWWVIARAFSCGAEAQIMDRRVAWLAEQALNSILSRATGL